MIRHELRMPHPTEVSRFVVWDLSAGTYRIESAAGTVISSGVGPRLLDRGVEGMGHPEMDVFSRSTPRGSGRVRTGTRAQPRSGFLPVYIDERGGDWVATQRLLWSCLSPDSAAAWRVYAPDDSWRELNVFLGADDITYKLDPSEFATVIGLPLIADDPFWLGPEQVAATARESSNTQFFGTGAPPFNIVAGAAGSVGHFVVAGDVEVWPVLTVSGEASGFRVADFQTTDEVSGAITVGANQKLVIDFDPRSQAAMLRAKSASTGGTNVTAQLASRKFFPVSPTFVADVQLLELTMIGAGEMTLTYRPKYWRAI